MGRQPMAAVRAVARCLPSTPMARVLQTCIVSPLPSEILFQVNIPTATAPIRLPVRSSSGSGTVFALNTDGTGFTNLHSFPDAIGDPFSGQYTNGDGANPIAGLI